MPKRLSSLFIILSLLFLFPGCAPYKTSPVSRGVELPFPHLLEILEKIDLDHYRKDALKAIARIEVNTAQGRYPVKAAIMIKRPSSLRLEVLPPLGPPELILSVHEQVLKVFLPQKGEFYFGQASEKNMSHFFPFPLEGLVIEDIVSILLGTHPNVRGKSLTLTGTTEERFYLVDIFSEKRKIQSLFIDNENNTLMKVDLFDDNRRLHSVKFMGQIIAEKLTAPDTITMTSGNSETPHITIRYSDVQSLTEADAASFALQTPPNVKIISLD